MLETTESQPLLSESEVDAMEARERAATEGPWDWSYHPTQYDGVMAVVSVPLDKDVLLCTGNDSEAWGEISEADATFFKHARTDIPALTRDWRALCEVVAYQRGLLDLAEFASESSKTQAQGTIQEVEKERDDLRGQLAQVTIERDELRRIDSLKSLTLDNVEQKK